MMSDQSVLARFPFSRAKLSRGRTHTAELEAMLAAFLAEKPVLAIQYDRYAGGQYTGTMQAYTRKTMPPAAVMVFGDAVHNLRAALDHLINEVVAQRSTPPTDLAFPFSRDVDGLGKQIREKMKDTTPAERDLVRRIRPYPGGNELLVALHKLDLRDKHRSPIEMSVITQSGWVKFDGYRPDGAPNMVHRSKFSEVPSDIVPLLRPVPGATRLGVIDDAEIIPVLSKGLPLENEPVVKALRQMSDAVEGVIEEFSALSANASP